MEHKHFLIILVSSMLLAGVLVLLAFSLNAYVDKHRVLAIEQSLTEQENAMIASLLKEDFTRLTDKDSCPIRGESIEEMKEKIRTIGSDLTRYGQNSVYTERLDFLKRRYFIAQLEMLSLLRRYNDECDANLTSIIFFYRIDHRLSERQGAVIEELVKNDPQTYAFVFDVDYPDEPLLKMLKDRYDIRKPSIVIEDTRHDLLMSQGELITRIADIRRAFPIPSPDWQYVVRAAGLSTETIAEQLEDAEDPLAQADTLLMRGRLLDDREIECESLKYYQAVNASMREEALAELTMASLSCGQDRKPHYERAAEHYEGLGESLVAQILTNISGGSDIHLRFDPARTLPENLSKTAANEIIIGQTGMLIDSSDTIVAQVDRVYRDWLGAQLTQTPFAGEKLTVFSERHTYTEEDLRSDIGWHEGGRLKQIADHTNATITTAPGALVARKNGTWYAPDDQGVFRFEVPLDKVLYPTTRFLDDDIAYIIDTHGVNVIVPHAIRENASVVYACCDHPGKIEAARYLASQGIASICAPDRFVPLLLGSDEDVPILGSPPLHFEQVGTVPFVRVGSQQIRIATNETVIVTNATLEPYALWYYTTPTLYFERLAQMVDIEPVYVQIDGYDQMQRIVDAARTHEASVIATRVFSRSDAQILGSWLDESDEHRAILFHSLPYPYGFAILTEYPEQVSFDDINPRFV